MTITLLLFLLAALVLFVLLLWAARPQTDLRSPEGLLQSLTEERHYYRLPQIMQSLQREDPEFLTRSGQSELGQKIRDDRRRIALRYLEVLQKDFETLLKASAVLATMAPDLAPMQEWERLKLSVRFAVLCSFLKYSLRLGLSPLASFGKLSEMASGIAMRLDAATARISERAALASEFPSFLEQGRGNSL
jgi:hypothetical protein